MSCTFVSRGVPMSSRRRAAAGRAPRSTIGWRRSEKFSARPRLSNLFLLRDVSSLSAPHVFGEWEKSRGAGNVGGGLIGELVSLSWEPRRDFRLPGHPGLHTISSLGPLSYECSSSSTPPPIIYFKAFFVPSQ